MAFRKKTVKDVDVAGKTVLVRVDYNVPMKDGAVVEDMRIRGSLQTINYLLDNGAKKVILISHLGRPEGQINPKLSLAPVAARLAVLMPEKVVRFVDATVGDKVKQAVAEMPEGSVLLLENLRFSPMEEANAPVFADAIVEATGAELFVQDGFAVIHRAHASTSAIAQRVPSVAGFLLEHEVGNLEAAIAEPERPLLVIIGGAKVADKQPMINNFLPIADMVAVGGKIAADGYQVPAELGEAGQKIFVANDFATDESGAKLDIGEQSTAKIVEMVKQAKTIVWNGTLGMVEDERFEKASLAVAEAMGASDGLTIVGGGDTTGYVEKVLRTNPNLHFKLISTGGGASLELLSGEKLPGFEILQDKE